MVNVGGDELHRAVAEKQDVVGGEPRQLAQLLRAEAERFAVADLSLLQRLDDVGEHGLVNRGRHGEPLAAAAGGTG